jgi:hypothetical protein
LHQNEDLQKQLLQQQKLQQQQQQHPPKVDPKQKQSKSPIKGASPVPMVVAAAALIYGLFYNKTKIKYV